MSIRRLLMTQGDPMAEVEGLTPLSVVSKKNRVANDYNIYGHDGIVMNQYFKENDSYKFSECSIKTEENIVTATWTEASTNLQSNVYKEKICMLNKGIKLFYRFSIMAKDDNVKIGMIAFPTTSTIFDTTRNIQLSPNKWISHSGIATIGVDIEKLIMAVTAQRANVLIISSYSVKDVNIINLTQMFGAGNEPTSSDEYAQRLGYNSIDDVPYIPYNEGEVSGVGDKQQDGTYKIPVNVNGETKYIYLNSFLLQGDYTSFKEQKVLRTDGTSEDATIPPLDLARGTNIIDVNTTIKPEKISVKARGIKSISV